MTTPTTTDVPTIAPADLIAVRLLAEGYTVFQIARKLNVGESAMCMRLSRMRDRIAARTNAHAIVILARAGQLDLRERTR
ncbi:hypothetical protein [Micromonospora endolithica]|uniref:LuxR family transcriptional regulator n=1 Tax=Micromonospora endolithica TaxID=230091 RepID=A0A3A9YT91_9ACTN|nr:hypothetical protein [Micromonospora endolithica]RKN38476.1 hypothetical protein D7223_31225 [Micromonospora endolithica]TWJ23100.1 hypothetical protein JD76_03229 [Micromonospora endolithica]